MVPLVNTEQELLQELWRSSSAEQTGSELFNTLKFPSVFIFLNMWKWKFGVLKFWAEI